MRSSQPILAAAGVLLAGYPSARAQTAAPATITVQVNKPIAPVPKNMFGLFFEDINFAADGGLYPELVKNKSFEYDDHLIGWKAIRGAAGLESYVVSGDRPISNANSHFLRLSAKTAGPDAGFVNEGFRGMGVKDGAEYTFSVYARKGAGNVSGLTVTLQDGDRTLAQGQITGLTGEWKKYAVVLKPSATAARDRLKLTLDGAGAVDLDVVSLFPKDTWLKRENGLRPDLVQLLKDMKPGFLRFPGGCIVEGMTLDNRYQWKQTIGDVASRQPMINRWNKEFKWRYTPDYYQSFGLGFFEYFQLAEDIGAEPLPILNVGMACQYNSAELAPISASAAKGPNAADAAEPTLDTFIQDALDLVEFANGPASRPWGARRVAMGHPAPFNLKMLGIGNEQWGPQYLERYEPFAKALKAKYPNIQLVSSAGPSPEGANFDLATKRMRELNAEYIDEHYYAKPEWFRQNVGRYDNYPRTGSKIFAGEYAAQSAGIANNENKNNWDCALSEAAFMTGLERNADVVSMASYAPMLAHVDAWQWTPNLIWFDNLNAYGTVNYYVQQLFSQNKGTTMLPLQLPANAKNGTDNLFASAVADDAAGELVVKLVNYSAAPRAVAVNMVGAKKLGKTGRALVMAADDLNTQNSLQEPKKLVPQEVKFAVSGPVVSYTLAPNSLTVLRIPGRK
ncbi:alpha-L-arabinofuranosidase C-terminal domain-containing protein [Hymenobacter properus]|uniref:non-reducing end alpha-L-arabinofuranosidase n=1 Tax=Hymenobacter properus TaxID=2791026 RepID=A0A931BPG0_9BACT|nr:alpha-L-arabinofuranosidase C-terminal domain-containing protein [Hymenobacter properus]MBF9143200.1 carbohydrate binding domain-containing protein [Hymenobacter properus]MBR7722009.1 carbohydrate binding domain-containing protein [Microvirga sp. SRT04]